MIEQLAAVEIAPQGVMIEPAPRNTAPAILAAALHLAARDPDAVMLVLPSDHVIPDAAAFRQAVQSALPRAQAGDLVTFGIIAAGLWPQIAYVMILYLTGLNNVAPDQIEAARLDGAKGWRMLWYVVLPQLRPATFIAVIVTVIGALGGAWPTDGIGRMNSMSGEDIL